MSCSSLSFLIFAAILGSSGLAAAQFFPHNCNTTRLTECLTGLTTHLNISYNDPYNQPRNFRTAVERFYQQNDQWGFLGLCRSFLRFKECLRGEYHTCLSPQTYLNSGLQNAYDFISVFNQVHFTCGAGSNVYLRNEPCIAETWRGHRQQFDQCYFQYHAQVEAGGDGAGCVADRALSNCFEFEFASHCSATRTDVIWWGCEYGRTFSLTQFPQCARRCTTYRVGGI